MNSAISTDNVPATAGSRKPDAGDQGFQISHFFVLLSLVAATVAVMLARPSAPENLILTSLTIGAAGLAAILLYRTIAPLVDPRVEEGREPVNERVRADLEREKALTLRSIKELEFDRAMGKVSQQDCDQMTERLRARAMGIMKQLDASASLYRQQVERDLAARLAGAPAAKMPDLPASAKAAAGEQVRPCACGTANDADARFCKSCGASLTASVS